MTISSKILSDEWNVKKKKRRKEGKHAGIKASSLLQEEQKTVFNR